MKYFIISQPKAGTYLCSNLLKELGIKQTGMHCKGTGLYQQYDLTDPEAVRKPKEYTHTLPSFKDVLDIIPEESFAVGHLHHSIQNAKYLKNFKKILVVRPYSDFEEAAKRFKEDLNRKVSSSERDYRKIQKWQGEKNVFVINFYDMINRDIIKINQLQLYLFGEIKFKSKNVINNALQADSLTKTSIRK